MIRGLLAKTFHEVWLQTLLFGFGMLLVMALLTHVVPQAQHGLDEVLSSMPWVRTIMGALLGSDLGEEISARMLQSIVWVHPTVLAILWAHEIVFCTRLPAGEIDRGTIDILLGLPVSRRVVFVCESAVWLASGAYLLAMGGLGHLLAGPASAADGLADGSRFVIVLSNLYCVYLAVGGLAYLVSAMSDRRGRAVAVVFSIVLASFLLNFLAQFWEPAKRVAFLGLLNYYSPAEILRTGSWPLRDMFVLVSFAVLCWTLGCEIFARRSISTV